ncbi:MAG: Gfo/Idh/MocA family oxidoreductase [Myxococcales bacterium]|nr:Gfo/Idh/MocA family oxidoreductase [Myxococcales bacterium]
MGKAPLRIGVVGAGRWGINHVRVVASDPGCVVHAVCDPDPAVAASVAALTAAPLHRELASLLADPALDAVVIATPAPTHAALAIAALTAGKHVLVEKPLALSLPDAERVAAVAAAQRRCLMVGHLMLYHPVVTRLAAILRSGELGHLHYLHATRVNLGRLRRDENALWSFGPHDLAVIDALLGELPVSVAARGQCVLQPGIEDVVFLSLRYPSGPMAHVHLSWLHPRKERRLTLVCSQKMAELDDVAVDKLRIFDKGFDRSREFKSFDEYLTIRDGDVHIPHVTMGEPLRLQLHHFLECVANEQPPLSDGASGVRVVRILDAAQRSLALDGVPVLLAAPP